MKVYIVTQIAYEYWNSDAMGPNESKTIFCVFGNETDAKNFCEENKSTSIYGASYEYDEFEVK